jgi:hypothetical protein
MTISFKGMKEAILNTLYNMLDLLGLWWSGAYDYYEERSVKLSVSFLCRQNKYTKRKYFRTMRPIGNGWDDNEWIEYTGKVDDLINKD